MYRKAEPTGVQGPYARRKPEVNFGRKKEGAQILEYNNKSYSAQVIPASLDKTRVIWTQATSTTDVPLYSGPVFCLNQDQTYWSPFGEFSPHLVLISHGAGAAQRRQEALVKAEGP